MVRMHTVLYIGSLENVLSVVHLFKYLRNKS